MNKNNKSTQQNDYNVNYNYNWKQIKASSKYYNSAYKVQNEHWPGHSTVIWPQPQATWKSSETEIREAWQHEWRLWTSAVV